MSHNQQFATRAIHGGVQPDPTTGAILTPIFQSTTFVQEGVGIDKGYTYSRTGNPTVAALEASLGELEGGLPACCFATGMAATTTLFLALLKAGDRVVISDVVYGGTTRLLREVLGRFGVVAEFVDTSDLAAVEQALQKPARLLFIETPANPTMKLTDIAACAKLAKAAGALIAVDNTFLTPALQSPFELGADIIVYSTTKAIEGHNATVGGAVLVQDSKLDEQIRFVKGTAGTTQAPFEAWLTLKGIKTLPLRIEKHSRNALLVAKYLEQHEEIARVDYPWLDSFPQKELARRQQKDGGGLLSFELKGGVEAGKRLMSSLNLIALAENLGATESLITHPATMTHASVPVEERQRIGISDGLVRLSVGLENPNDIIADLEQALAAAVKEQSLV
jgi:cystathionine beta-lyase/cystathionine gamma-synthase